MRNKKKIFVTSAIAILAASSLIGCNSGTNDNDNNANLTPVVTNLNLYALNSNKEQVTSFSVGQTLELNYTFDGDVVDYKVTFASSDDSIISITKAKGKNLAVALENGSATISLTISKSSYLDVTASLLLEVKENSQNDNNQDNKDDNQDNKDNNQENSDNNDNNNNDDEEDENISDLYERLYYSVKKSVKHLNNINVSGNFSVPSYENSIYKIEEEGKTFDSGVKIDDLGVRYIFGEKGIFDMESYDDPVLNIYGETKSSKGNVTYQKPATDDEGNDVIDEHEISLADILIAVYVADGNIYLDLSELNFDDLFESLDVFSTEEFSISSLQSVFELFKTNYISIADLVDVLGIEDKVSEEDKDVLSDITVDFVIDEIEEFLKKEVFDAAEDSDVKVEMKKYLDSVGASLSEDNDHKVILNLELDKDHLADIMQDNEEFSEYIDDFDDVGDLDLTLKVKFDDHYLLSDLYYEINLEDLDVISKYEDEDGEEFTYETTTSFNMKNELSFDFETDVGTYIPDYLSKFFTKIDIKKFESLLGDFLK